MGRPVVSDAAPLIAVYGWCCENTGGVCFLHKPQPARAQAPFFLMRLRCSFCPSFPRPTSLDCLPVLALRHPHFHCVTEVVVVAVCPGSPAPRRLGAGLPGPRSCLTASDGILGQTTGWSAVCHAASPQLPPTTSFGPVVSRLGAGCPAATAGGVAAATEAAPSDLTGVSRRTPDPRVTLLGSLAGNAGLRKLRTVAVAAAAGLTPGANTAPCCGCGGMYTGCKGCFKPPWLI